MVRSAAIDLAVRLRDWPRVQNLLRAGAWGPVPAEVVEQAFRAHRLADAESRSALPQCSHARRKRAAGRMATYQLPQG